MSFKIFLYSRYLETTSSIFDNSIDNSLERLTSVISNRVLIDANMSRNKRKKKVDGMAAVIILQGYLDKIKR